MQPQIVPFWSGNTGNEGVSHFLELQTLEKDGREKENQEK